MRIKTVKFFLIISFLSSTIKVEWDSKAGQAEVQRISSHLNLNANEVQTITTMADDVDELQVVSTSATPRGEIQTITVSPPPGETTLNPLYSFSVKLNTISTGGSIQFSGDISATASPYGSSSSLSEILGAMPNINSDPTVSKSSPNPDGGHTYSITFHPSMKDPPELEPFLSDVPILISTRENGNILGGYFQLEYQGEMTIPISYDVDEGQLQNTLEDLNSIEKVIVRRSDSDDQLGYSWSIQFISDKNGGNLDNLIVHSEGLTTSNSIGGALAKIDTGGVDGSYITGTFTLSFGMY